MTPPLEYYLRVRFLKNLLKGMHSSELEQELTMMNQLTIIQSVTCKRCLIDETDPITLQHKITCTDKLHICEVRKVILFHYCRTFISFSTSCGEVPWFVYM